MERILPTMGSEEPQVPKVNVSDRAHRALKLAAALESISISDLIDRLTSEAEEARREAATAILGAFAWERGYRGWGRAPAAVPEE